MLIGRSIRAIQMMKSFIMHLYFPWLVFVIGGLARCKLPTADVTHNAFVITPITSVAMATILSDLHLIAKKALVVFPSPVSSDCVGVSAATGHGG